MRRLTSFSKNFVVKFFACAIIFASVIAPTITIAASLVVNPAAGTYNVGQTFSVSVSTNSASQSMNAASATIDYSSSTMEIISISKSPSIFSLWVQEPTYSNQTGTSNFEGVVFNPGYTGSSGRLITYTFRAKSAGAGWVRVTNGTILANDGNGTNIYTGATSAAYTITAGKQPELPKPVDTSVVDSQLPPILDIREIGRDDLTTPTAQFSIAVINTTEPYRKYQIRIDQDEPIVWDNASGKEIFTTPTLLPGSHTLLVKTLDSNRKSITGYVDFLVDSLESPKIAYFTKIATVNDPVAVYGSAKPGSLVTVSFVADGKSVYQEEALIDAQGSFITIVDDKLPRGAYTLDVFTHNDTGARSPVIADMKIHVTSNFYIKIGGLIIESYLLAAILGTIVLIVILAATWRTVHRKRNVVIDEIIPEKPKRRRKTVVRESTE